MAATGGFRGAPGGHPDALLAEAAGYDNFCVVTVELTELEALDLNHLGHSRRRWTRSESGHERWEVAP